MGRKCADRLIAELAERGHSVVSRLELLAAGVTDREIGYRLHTGRLWRVYSGVYAVGVPPLAPLGRCMAAALAAGEGGVLSHRGAAWLWGLPQGLPESLDVSCPRRRRSRPGLRCHEARVPGDERAVRSGIPVTGPARSILDVAPVTEAHRLERMIERAERDGLHSGVGYAELLRRYPCRPGAPKLRAVLGLWTGPALTRSDWEAMVLAFCDRHGIQRPRTNFLFAFAGRNYELDAFWPDRMIALEFDSWEHHGGRVSFRDDRIRDRALAKAGVQTIRITAWDLGEGEAALAADLEALVG